MMKKSANYVLYALDDNDARRALFSCGEDDAMASAKVQHAASAEYRKAEQRGVPLPPLVCVLEERAANEHGQQTSAKFAVVSVSDLKPQGEPFRDLADVFAAMKE